MRELQRFVFACLLAAGLALSLTFAAGVAGSLTADAAPKCAKNSKYFKEFGCVLKAEVAKAKRICDANGMTVNKCLCDAGEVLACAPAKVKAGRCRAKETFVAKWGCVKDSEIKNAARICAALPEPALFTECLCQDGKKIGACGD